MRSVAVLLVAIATLFAATGCGPSLRRMHRSEVYFERCYAADFDAQVPIEERRACWQEWMVHWKADQPPDRIDYVRERVLRLDPERAAIVALSTGATEPDDAAPEIAAEAMNVTEALGRDATDAAAPEIAFETAMDVSRDGGAPLAGGVEQPAVSIERPAVVIAPEPDTAPATVIVEPALEPRTIAPARERRMQRAPVMPASDHPHCAEACRPGWVQCTGGCDTGDRAACIRACRLELRACSRACY